MGTDYVGINPVVQWCLSYLRAQDQLFEEVKKSKSKLGGGSQGDLIDDELDGTLDELEDESAEVEDESAEDGSEAAVGSEHRKRPRSNANDEEDASNYLPDIEHRCEKKTCPEYNKPFKYISQKAQHEL